MINKKVIRAEVLGYCMGVRRAVDTALCAVVESKNTDKKEVKTLGPLIHNRLALQSLRNQGLGQIDVDQLDEIDPLCAPVVVLRAHGVPPIVKKKLIEKNCKIVDATCPRVLSSQKRAALYAQKGCTIILAGDKNHGEITSIQGYAQEKGQSCYVVENSVDAKDLVENETIKKAVLIAQTTISKDEYDVIATVLKEGIDDITVINTICPATKQRQDALKDLCKKVDGIVVVGGKNSANTRRLFMNAKRWLSGPVCHIEKSDEIPLEFYSLERIGLSAGASTPDEIIDEVERAFVALVK